MRKEKQQKTFYCTINTECSYGKIVINALETLKDRMGLPVSRILQDALILYEMYTRNKECSMPCLSTDIGTDNPVQFKNKMEDEVKKAENTAEILGLLEPADIPGFHV